MARMADDQVTLEVVAGSATGATIVVEDRLLFGRQSEDAGRLGEDPELSREHALISRQPSGEYTIEDLSSMNGTFVNRTRIDSPVVLSAGDLVDMGATSLIVRSAPVAGPPEVDVRAPTVVREGIKAEEEAGAPDEHETQAPLGAAEAPPDELAPLPATGAAQASPAELGSAPDMGALEQQPIPPPREVAKKPPSGQAPESSAEELQPTAIPRLELRLVIDLQRIEIELALADGDRVRLKAQGDRWQLETEDGR
jgi:pSer/pThr/pTyr-binding forkhead associated (FHA) protein